MPDPRAPSPLRSAAVVLAGLLGQALGAGADRAPILPPAVPSPAHPPSPEAVEAGMGALAQACDPTLVAAVRTRLHEAGVSIFLDVAGPPACPDQEPPLPTQPR